ncbi:MAG: LysM peptidoglycan-binding domain-containing protein [Cyanobacteriota bacterium]
MGASLVIGPRPVSPKQRLPWPLALAALLLALSLTPLVPASAQGSGGSRTVTVRSGDTLDGISQRTGVPVADLQRINGLKDADLLQVGQVLRLSSPPPPPRKAAVVVIKSGDTLEIIAKAHNTTAAALQKANPGIQPENLKVGSSLRLPTASPSAPAKSAASVSAAGKAATGASTPGKNAAGSSPPAKATAAPTAAKATTPPLPAAKPSATPPTTTPPPQVRLPEAPPLTPPSGQPPAGEKGDSGSRGRWRYYGDTVVDWGSWKRLQDGVRFTLVQAAARDVGEERAQATAIAVDCSTLRHTWRVKEAWETWSVPAPRSVAQQIVLDLCGNTATEDRRPVPPPPSPTP